MALLRGASRTLGKWPAIGLPLMVWGLFTAPALAQSPNEYEVKAVFLYRFAMFVEWPPAASNGALCIGIVGQDPFGETLERVVKNKLAGGRRIAVQRFKSGESARNCQIVFINLTDKKRVRAILDGLRGASVLTVGETAGFCQMGGVINFELVEDSVRFEVNADSAERAGLRLSSKLLGVAKVVREASH